MKEINSLVIVKRQGAAGGKGYFLATNETEFNNKREKLIKEGLVTLEERKQQLRILQKELPQHGGSILDKLARIFQEEE